MALTAAADPGHLCLIDGTTCPRFIEDGTNKPLHLIACPTCSDTYIGELPAEPCADCAATAEARRRTFAAPGGR